MMPNPSATVCSRIYPIIIIFTFLGTESGDGTVSLESQLRPEAQEDTFRLYGLFQFHTGDLNDPETSELLNRILSYAGTKLLYDRKP